MTVTFLLILTEKTKNIKKGYKILLNSYFDIVLYDTGYLGWSKGGDEKEVSDGYFATSSKGIRWQDDG